MPSWPGTLPTKPLMQGAQEKKQDQTVRSSMDTGPPKVRRRFSAAKTDFSVAFILTTAQMTTLDTFFDTTLLGGSLAFDWTHPRTGVSYSFRFIGPYTVVPVSGSLYSVSAQMEALP